jgi:hypothetical protein
MNNQPIPPLIDFFRHIKDPRIELNKAYPLNLRRLSQKLKFWESLL